MDWLNLHIPTVIRSPEYIGSSPAERGTWLSVIAYACTIECGGILVGAAAWKDRQWQQSCGVTLREVRAASRLLRVSGDDVIVNGYPASKEAHVRQARGAGMAGAMARWGKRSDSANTEPIGETMPTGMPTGIADGIGEKMATGIANANAEGEGEGEEEEIPPLPPEGGAKASAKKSHPPPPPEFPPPLDTHEFRTAWADWLAYRRERRLSAYKPRTVTAQLATLAEWGESAAITAIRDSVRNQWQGLFPPKPTQGALPRRPPSDPELFRAF